MIRPSAAWLTATVSFLLAAVIAIIALSGPDSGDAAYPGTNGRITFTSGSRDDVNEQVYVMDADGTNIQKLTDQNVARAPSWSPDGTHIAFTGGPSNNDIFVMNADGTNETQLTTDPAGEHNPTWSPDGTRIAFDTVRDGGIHEIYVMNADGSDQTRITNNTAIDATPAWSPDGSRIAFTRADTFSSPLHIYAMNPDGTGQVPLTTGANGGNDPDWSPDGSKLVFTSNREGNFEVYSMNADGTDQTRLTNDATNQGYPVWSPDGTKIAYISYVNNTLGEVFVMNADGTNQTRLTNDAPYDTAPSWEPIPNPATPTDSPTPVPTATEPGGDIIAFGDLDCNGEISSRDNQALLRNVLTQAALSQTEPCPDIGSSVGITVPAGAAPLLWGDLDCNGQISSRDNQALLRNVLTQAALSQTEPCPDIGQECSSHSPDALLVHPLGAQC